MKLDLLARRRSIQIDEIEDSLFALVGRPYECALRSDTNDRRLLRSRDAVGIWTMRLGRQRQLTAKVVRNPSRISSCQVDELTCRSPDPGHAGILDLLHPGDEPAGSTVTFQAAAAYSASARFTGKMMSGRIFWNRLKRDSTRCSRKPRIPSTAMEFA